MMVLVVQNRVTQFRRVNAFSRFAFMIFLKTVFVNHKLLFRQLHFDGFMESVNFDFSTSIGASYLRKLKLQFGRVVILNCCLGS